MNNLEEEFLQAMSGLDEPSVAWLKRKSVPRIVVDMWPGPIGVAPIETDTLSCFEFIPNKRRAYIQPVLSGGEFTDIIDLVAWYPEEPNRWWTRRYSGEPLGVDQFDRAELLGEPLLLQPTPLDWLGSRGQGACILDWKTSICRLRNIPALIFNDAAFGLWVHETLAQPPLAIPEIKILTSEAA